MTLTKRDLVLRISEETGLIQSQVFDVVQKTLDYITESLAKGDKVELRNFGVFDVKIRKARCKRRLKSAAGGARKVPHLPSKGNWIFRSPSSC
jgi:nucleoid DNA-binding protein